ncbi:MAG: flagellar basal body rod protein FlgC [Tumebacillaceae bacterium]
MGLFDSMGISASGLTAQRLRLDVISGNIANANTTRGADGQPYRRQVVTFAERLNNAISAQPGSVASQGVRVSGIGKDDSPYKLVYDPSHPDAIKQLNDPLYGYVRMPNVDIATEMVDMISASRAYEANVTAINASKALALKALEIGK